MPTPLKKRNKKPLHFINATVEKLCIIRAVKSSKDEVISKIFTHGGHCISLCCQHTEINAYHKQMYSC